MRGTSLRSREAVREEFAPVLAAAGADAETLGGQLFVVADAVDTSGALQRSLTDLSRSDRDKKALAEAVLAGCDARVRAIAGYAAGREWAKPRDLVLALERVGVDAVLSGAEQRGKLDTVQTELFEVTRAIMGNRELSDALSDPLGRLDQRQVLLRRIFGGKVDEATATLIERAAASLTHHHIVPALQELEALAAERQHRSIATVIVSAALSSAQVDRLTGLLERTYSRPIQVDQIIDPAVVGGVRIQIGNDVIDSTMLARLAEARRELVS